MCLNRLKTWAVLNPFQTGLTKGFRVHTSTILCVFKLFLDQQSLLNKPWLTKVSDASDTFHKEHNIWLVRRSNMLNVYQGCENVFGAMR